MEHAFFSKLLLFCCIFVYPNVYFSIMDTFFSFFLSWVFSFVQVRMFHGELYKGASTTSYAYVYGVVIYSIYIILNNSQHFFLKCKN